MLLFLLKQGFENDALFVTISQRGFKQYFHNTAAQVRISSNVKKKDAQETVRNNIYKYGFHLIQQPSEFVKLLKWCVLPCLVIEEKNALVLGFSFLI